MGIKCGKFRAESLMRVRHCLFGDHCSSSSDWTVRIPLSLIFGDGRIIFSDSIVADSVKIPQILFAKVPQDSFHSSLALSKICIFLLIFLYYGKICVLSLLNLATEGRWAL